MTNERYNRGISTVLNLLFVTRYNFFFFQVGACLFFVEGAGHEEHTQIEDEITWFLSAPLKSTKNIFFLFFQVTENFNVQLQICYFPFGCTYSY